MKKIKKSQILTMFYQIMVFNSILNSSQFSRIPYFSLATKIILLTLVVLGVLLWMIGKKQFDKALISIALILFMASIIVMKESDSQIVIILMLYLAIVYKDYDPRLFCKKYVGAAVMSLFLVFVLFSIGVFPCEFRYRVLASGLIRYRYNLGFIHTTTSANYVFHVSLAYLFYKKENYQFKDTILLLVPNTILYFLTNTRAAYYEVLFVIIVFWLLKVVKRDWLKRIVGFLSVFLMPFFAMVELFIANDYKASNPFYSWLDYLLSYRLSWVAKALKVYSIGLFGNKVIWETSNYNDASQLVDMFYLRCAIQYGIIFLVIVIIGFMGMGVHFKIQEDYFGCAIIITLAIHSVTDPQLIEYSSVPLLITFLTGYKSIYNELRLKRIKFGWN